MHGAACGLLHIHESGKVHRDIKAGNIIVTVNKESGSGTGKVADFGLTCGEEPNNRNTTIPTLEIARASSNPTEPRKVHRPPVAYRTASLQQENSIYNLIALVFVELRFLTKGCYFLRQKLRYSVLVFASHGCLLLSLPDISSCWFVFHGHTVRWCMHYLCRLTLVSASIVQDHKRQNHPRFLPFLFLYYVQ